MPRQKRRRRGRQLEATRQGAIPKIAADGARPFRAFAHPRQLPPDKTDAPRIAIIVGGLGISATGTADACRSCRGR